MQELFLDPLTCERLRDEMRAGKHAPATVYRRSREKVLDERARRALSVEVTPRTSAFVKEKLMGLLPLLRHRFNVVLNDCQTPSFLIYKPGDFFEPHRDQSDNESTPDSVRRRTVSAVIFLSNEAAGEDSGDYAGGSLALYGLLNDPRCERIGIPVRGREGLLVAFRSELFHQVTPVTSGERFTIVSWFV
ncbi:MAG TPA: 2OG-Fe(II) oxygenase [Pyrinomonadaceae bacterium]|nr:2OG-Fe(II) oxygenase [Pyrinomonadaceae bacterium]